MSQPTRWGIAGTGAIATEMADALRGLEGAELVAVASRSAKRADHFGARFDVANRHRSYEAMAGDNDVDVVYVATPHHRHRDDTVLYLEAGRHVLCEKAFALNGQQAREMAAAAARTDRFLMEAMWTWFIPAIAELRARLRAGSIGAPRIIRSDFGERIDEPTGRMVEPELGGGSLLDLGVYPVAFSRYLLGPPNEIKALGQLGRTGVDVNVGGLLGHDDGAVAVFSTSLDAFTPRAAEIVGTDGVITVDAPFWSPTSFEIDAGGHRERVEIPHRGLAHEAGHVQDCIQQGRRESKVLPLSESIAVMDTLDELRAEIGLRYPGES